MADPKSRAKVLRLLRGDFRAGDLTDLFLYARDHCDGRETVKDIGDFAAHHSERNRGIITRSTREWFTVVRFHMASFQPNQPRALHANQLPSVTRDYLRMAVNRMDAKAIKESENLTRADAFKIAQALADRLTQNSDSTWALPLDISKTEKALFQALADTMVVKPAFDDNRLVEDFLATLKSNGLVTKDEVAAHKQDLSAIIKLYAVSAMHNCIVQIGDGNTSRLKGAIHQGATDQISVSCSISAGLSTMPNLSIACDIFTANISIIDHCEPSLLIDSANGWDFEIEVGPNKKLCPLR